MQVPTSSYCTPIGLDCVAKVAKEAFECNTPCTGVYTDVFRADDTKLTTEMMKLANLVHDLANEGDPQLHYDFGVKQARKLQDAQAEKLKSSHATKLTS